MSEDEMRKAAFIDEIAFEIEERLWIRLEEYSGKRPFAPSMPFNARILASNIRNLAAADFRDHQAALDDITDCIYHAGVLHSGTSLFESTVVVVPYLIRLALYSRIPVRGDILIRLGYIAGDAFVSPAYIRRGWRIRNIMFGSGDLGNGEEMAEEAVSVTKRVQSAFQERLEELRTLIADPELDKWVWSLVRIIETPIPEVAPCNWCRTTGRCKCARKGKPKETCKSCKGSGICQGCFGIIS